MKKGFSRPHSNWRKKNPTRNELKSQQDRKENGKSSSEIDFLFALDIFRNLNLFRLFSSIIIIIQLGLADDEKLPEARSQDEERKNPFRKLLLTVNEKLFPALSTLVSSLLRQQSRNY